MLYNEPMRDAKPVEWETEDDVEIAELERSEVWQTWCVDVSYAWRCVMVRYRRVESTAIVLEVWNVCLAEMHE
jgi:hypothetical protein